MKRRLHELSKELGVENKVLIGICQQIGIPVKSHASMLDPVEIERIKISLRARGHKLPVPGAPAAKPAEGKPADGQPGQESKNPFTVKVIEEKPDFGQAVKHVKLERVIKRGPGPRRPGGPPSPGFPSSPGAHRPGPSAPSSPRAADGVLEAAKGKTFAVQTPVSLKNLSAVIGIKTGDLMKALMELGVMATINQVLDAYAVGLIAEKLGIAIDVKESQTLEEEVLSAKKSSPKDMKPRPPVVTVMGHVDHGKTTLLDRLRKTEVAAGEVGGITQHIGAYKVETPQGPIVFMDTPGHAAFTRMRSRGANVTDLVVLVVAGDDGVMPQTEEAVNHAKAAEVPLIVAVNKMDKPGADARKIMEQLSRIGVQTEAWGGKVAFIEISALTGKGIPELLERIHLESEVLDLKADPKAPARGTVVEAAVSEARGIVATVLVQDGTLKVGDSVVCGQAYGKVRSMILDGGKAIDAAPPSTPVQLTGLSDVPEAGAKMFVVDNLDKAREIAGEKAHKLREAEIARKQNVTLENLFSHIEQKKAKEINVIVKADVKGSVEVVAQALADLSTEEVRVRVLHQGVGAISESDVLLAHASHALVVGFHVVPEDKARALASGNGVEIRTYQIIYKMTEDVQKMMEGMLEPETREAQLGRAEIRQIFHASKTGAIAGCRVVSGLIRRNAQVRVVRDGKIVHEGKLDSLRHFKDDVREIKEGMECGLHIANFDDVKPGDVVEAFEMQKVARTLETAEKAAKGAG